MVWQPWFYPLYGLFILQRYIRLLQLRLWSTFFSFLPYLVCFWEMTNDVHQGIAACTSFVLFLGFLGLYTLLSLFSVPFGFIRCALVLRMISFAILYLIRSTIFLVWVFLFLRHFCFRLFLTYGTAETLAYSYVIFPSFLFVSDYDVVFFCPVLRGRVRIF